MKKYLIIANLFAVSISAQVGIQTEAPQQMFHIDASSNNANAAPVTDEQIADDFVVTAKGNVGIGDINPDQKLVVNGKFRLADGTQKNNALLVSDSEGNARWDGDISKSTKSARFRLSGNSLADQDTISLTGTGTILEDIGGMGLAAVGSSVHIPKGKYFVVLNGDIQGKREYCYLYLDAKYYDENGVFESEKKDFYHVAYVEYLSGVIFFFDVPSIGGADISMRLVDRLTVPTNPHDSAGENFTQNYYVSVRGLTTDWNFQIDLHKLGNLIFE